MSIKPEVKISGLPAGEAGLYSFKWGLFIAVVGGIGLATCFVSVSFCWAEASNGHIQNNIGKKKRIFFSLVCILFYMSAFTFYLPV